MTATVAFVCALLIALYLWVMGSIAARRGRHFRKIVRTERTRAKWADARIALLRLVQDDKLSARSATFYELYHIQTFVLRRPDAFEEIARSLHKSFFEAALYAAPRDLPLWLREMDKWPAGMGEVMALMAQGVEELIKSHLNLFRRAQVKLYKMDMRTRGLLKHSTESDIGTSKANERKAPAPIELGEVRDQLHYWERRNRTDHGSGDHKLVCV